MKQLIEYLNESSGITPQGVYDMAIQLQQDGKVKEVKKIDSGWGSNGFCFEIYYPKGLILKIDFVGRGEYIYEYRNDKGNESIGTNSTIETDSTDWEEFLNPSRHINQNITNLNKRIARAKGNSKRYYNAYNRSNKSSDYEKYIHEENWIKRWESRVVKYTNMLKLA